MYNSKMPKFLLRTTYLLLAVIILLSSFSVCVFADDEDSDLSATLLNNYGGAVTVSDLNAKGLRAQAWLAGLSAPVGESGKVMFSYQGGRVKNNDVVEGGRVNTHVWSLGYTHNLSKRTAVYAVVLTVTLKLRMIQASKLNLNQQT